MPHGRGGNTNVKAYVLPPALHTNHTFQGTDLYSRRRCLGVQHMVKEILSRWRKEYQNNLQVRIKQTRPKRNTAAGDIVLVKEDNTGRCQWHLGNEQEVTTDLDEKVRKVDLCVPKLPTQVLERPVHNQFLLCVV